MVRGQDGILFATLLNHGILKLKEEKITLSRFNIPCVKQFRGQYSRQDKSKALFVMYKAETLVQIKTNPMLSRVYVEELNFVFDFITLTFNSTNQ